MASTIILLQILTRIIIIRNMNNEDDNKAQRNQINKGVKQETNDSTKQYIRQYSTEALFCGDNEVLIQHEEGQYRLRITRNGKLILTK